MVLKPILFWQNLIGESLNVFVEHTLDLCLVPIHHFYAHVMRFPCQKNLVHLRQGISTFNVIQPFSHFFTVKLSLSDHLFILQSSFFEDAPFHVHENLHSPLFFLISFSLLFILFDCLLPSHGLNYDLLLVVLRPILCQFCILLDVVIILTPFFFKIALSTLPLEGCQSFSLNADRVFLPL